MRRNLSITTAAAALLLGTVFAAAQGVQRPGGAEPGAQQGQGGAQTAPQEGGKGKAQSKEPRTQGQGGQSQGQQGQAAPEPKEPKGKAQSKEPRTQGQGGQTQGQPGQAAPEPKEPKGKAQSKEPRTQGQGGQREGQPQQQQGQQPKQQPQQGQQTPRDTEKTQKGAETKGGAQTDVKLTTEQRTQIRTTVLQGSNAPRVSNVDFSVTVGTVVPRERVKLVAVPSTLVEIHPAWRGYLYFIVGERIIIVEPSSYKIVAVLVV